MSNKYLDIAIKKIVSQEVNKVLEQIRTEIEQKLSDNKYLESICPFGKYGEWYDGVKDVKSEVLNIIDKHLKGDKK